MLSKSSVLTLWTLLATWLGHFMDVTVSRGSAEPGTGPREPWEGAVSQGGVHRLESFSWDFTVASPVPA